MQSTSPTVAVARRSLYKNIINVQQQTILACLRILQGTVFTTRHFRRKTLYMIFKAFEIALK